MNIFVVIHKSVVDGDVIVDATPCADLHSAQAIMDEEIRTMLEEGKFSGLNLEEIERDQHDEDVDCDYALERNETSFYLGCVYDDYAEEIKIVEKGLKTIS